MKTILTLLFVLICSPCFAQRVSHPGGDLDSWITSLRSEYTVPPDVQPRVSSSYPTHSVRWHIIGSRESREELIQHLMTHPEHADVRRMYTANDLHRMTRAQLMTLHDDSHERRVQPKYAVRSVQTYTAYTAPYQSGCPGGVCPMVPSRIRARRQARMQARADAVAAGVVGANLQFGLINVSK